MQNKASAHGLCNTQQQQALNNEISAMSHLDIAVLITKKIKEVETNRKKSTLHVHQVYVA